MPTIDPAIDEAIDEIVGDYCQGEDCDEIVKNYCKGGNCVLVSTYKFIFFLGILHRSNTKNQYAN